MRIISKLALASIGASALSCSAEGYVQERSELREEAIYYGSLDSTHQAVVSVQSNTGNCTGTIIAVNGSNGYVLTAAHCVTGSGSATPLSASQLDVAMGNNYNNPSAWFNVAQVGVHPLYDGSDGSPNDFGMLRITGTSASTPFIPAMTPAQDNLAVGTNLNLVGFGRTESSYNNSSRRYVIKPIHELIAGWIVFDQAGTSGGTCQGDSGGPAITVGTERVAGVTSFGTGASCTEDGYNGRVSTVYDSFIKPFIDGTVGTISCAECDNSATYGTCQPKIDACFANSSCKTLVDCLNGCSNVTCQNQCFTSNPTGADIYSAIGECICNTCDSECANDPMCAAPTCGFDLTPAGCGTCSDASCCSQEQACADDATCGSCLGSSPPASCSSNAAWNTYYDCLAGSCGTECNINPDGCGLTTGNATCDGCFQTKCLTECKAATDEATLNSLLSCYQNCSDTACSNACDAQYPTAASLLGALDTCMGTNCATECGGSGTGGTGGFAGSGGTGGGTSGTGGYSGVGGVGAAAGAAGTAGTAGTAGAAGMAGAGATAGGAGTAGGTAGTGADPGAIPAQDTSGDSGGCATSSGSKNAGAAGALILLGAALAFLRRRR